MKIVDCFFETWCNGMQSKINYPPVHASPRLFRKSTGSATLKFKVTRHKKNWDKYKKNTTQSNSDIVP